MHNVLRASVGRDVLQYYRYHCLHEEYVEFTRPIPQLHLIHMRFVLMSAEEEEEIFALGETISMRFIATDWVHTQYNAKQNDCSGICCRLQIDSTVMHCIRSWAMYCAHMIHHGRMNLKIQLSI